MRRRTFLVSSVSSAVVLVHRGAVAQSAWPSRPVRMLIGYPPGGSTDVTARLLSEPLAKRLGQPVVLDNRAGAGGTLAANTVVRAEPDGYTLLFGASAEMTIAPVTMKAIPYDPLADLQPITQVGAVPFLLVVNPSVPANTLAEFIAHAKANPGKLNYSSFGNNTSNHLAGELFKVLTGTQTVHVPYKGSGPSITDLLAGQVQYTFDTPPAVARARARRQAARARRVGAPAVSRRAAGADVRGSRACRTSRAAPGRACSRRRRRHARSSIACTPTSRRCSRSPEMAKAFADRGIVPSSSTPDEFRRFMQAEVAKWKDLAAKAGIVAE